MGVGNCLAGAVSQSHGLEVHVFEVVETRGCRRLHIETATTELLVSRIHRAAIDDLEARRRTTTTLALNFQHV